MDFDSVDMIKIKLVAGLFAPLVIILTIWGAVTLLRCLSSQRSVTPEKKTTTKD